MSGPNTCGRYAASASLFIAGVMAFAVTAAGNYAYGLTQGTDAPFLFALSTRQVSAYACLAADIAAAGLAIAVVMFARERRWPAVFFAGVLCAVATVFAFSNTLGFLGMERSSAELLRKHGAGGYDGLAEDLARLRRERSWVPKHNAPDLVLAQVSEKEASPLYVRSRQCSWITTPESRILCDEIKALRTEAAAAGTAARMDREIAELQTRMNGTPPVVGSDFLASTLLRQFSIAEDATGVWQPFAKAAVLCFLSIFCFPFAEAVAPARRKLSRSVPVVTVVAPPEQEAVPPATVLTPAEPRKDAPYIQVAKTAETPAVQALDSPGRNVQALLARPVTPVQGVKDWAEQMDAGEHLFADATAAYSAYCKRRNITPVRLQQLGTTLRDLGYAVKKHKGKTLVVLPKSLAVTHRSAVG